ncbi:MAG: 4'-phosphopantetheinyl transferase family protein [Aeromonadaceae bacterium]
METHLLLLRLADADTLPVAQLDAATLARAQGMAPARRQSYLAGRYLLAVGLAQLYGVAACPELVLGEHGRPSFTDPGLPDFSLSHSGETLALVLGSGPLGLDIEQYRPRRNLQRLLESLLSPDEQAWLASEEDGLVAFYQLWTLREAILKASGRGLAGLSRLQLLPAERRLLTAEVAPGHVRTATLPQCALALYGPQVREIPCWQWQAASGLLPIELDWQPSYRVEAP